MIHALQTFAMLLIAVAMAPALAHAFEYPGKKRLDRDAYVAVQAIYYPGFTLLGVSEPLGLIAVIILLLFTPRETTAFWLTLVALFGVLGMQIVFWTLTQPTNKFWLHNAGTALGNAGGRFFAFNPAGGTGAAEDWKKLRSRWEYSHIARAGLAFLSFLALLLAIVVYE